jgi:2-oxoisovalerate dehydrogenase E1 component alpha subunit
MPSIRVDGNDVFAVYHAAKMAKKTIIEEETPILIEAFSYRLNGHSTNDDPSRYIDPEERKYHQARKPIARTEAFMKKHDLLDFDLDEFKDGIKKMVYEARDVGRNVSYGQWSSFFDDVYDEMPQHIA